MMVALAVDPSRRRRWIADLARRLLDAGFAVRLIDADRRPPVRSVGLLLDLERMLLRRHRPLGADPDALDALPPVGSLDRPNIVIDLSAAPAARPGARTLAVAFDGLFGEDALIGPLLAGHMPAFEIRDLDGGFDGGLTLERGRPSRETAVGIGGGMDAATTRLAALLVARLRDPDRPLPPPEAATARAGRALPYAARTLAATAALTLYRLCCHAPHWRVGWRHVTGPGVMERGDTDGVPFRVLPDPGKCFYADPFAATWQGRTAVFVEGLDHRVGRGFIAAVPFDGNGPTGPAVPVIEAPFHLSYPFLFEDGGALYMLPESSLADRLDVYRCVDFPHRWEKVATLLEGRQLGDATIVRHGGRLYMLAAERDGTGGYSDTLAIYSADTLFGPWAPHPGNPILVDVATARPAGAMVRRDGRLFRPVQDCTDGYGAAITLAEITRLDETGFAQTVIGRVRPSASWPGRKLHTLNRAGDLEVIDGAVIRPKLAGLMGFADRLQAPKPAPHPGAEAPAPYPGPAARSAPPT
ncbi:glucosamine inositolphosphorylceramide transferase family protein [Mongoliimonas terrestris]|uniref:glucosamine inositolphosphorylceramide transferase family protein n=1 Tax=Mongoliimonas terrestris TaxID=1709001 RepID=UPI00094953FD|nr:hypothetical protein [Mongoliimonas terrestris]